MTNKVEMYTKDICPYCVEAEQILRSHGLDDIIKINIEHDDELREKMMKETNMRTVPQIFINGKHVGGCDDLKRVVQENKLAEFML